MAAGTPASRLVDWGTATRVGGTTAGGPVLTRSALGNLRDELTEVVGEAEAAVSEFTGFRNEGPATRPWAMTRAEWVSQNVRGLETVLEPLAKRMNRPSPSAFAGFRRQALGFQVGLLLGYLGRKVLGQYDLFLPPDDRNLLYFVGPNLVSVERRYDFPRRDFRLWISLHEVDHRLQFEGVPWLRGYIMGLIDSYLATVELDPRKVAQALRRAVEEARSNDRWRGLGFVSLLMTPEQRETFRKMQATMSLLEGHGNYVMDALSDGRVRDGERMRRVMQERRAAQGLNRAIQRAIGMELKVRQYDMGERFVAAVVRLAGMEGFSRVWERSEHLPTLEEVRRPEAWVERVGAA